MESRDKKTILDAAQREPYKGYEKENREKTRGFMLTSFVALVLGMGFFLFEVIVKRTVNTGLLSIGFGAAATEVLFEGIALKTVWKIVLGAVLACLSILFAILYIRGFFQ